MKNECYVIYAIHKNSQTNDTEGLTMIACVSTEIKAQEFLQTEVDKYTDRGADADWFNETCIRIVDESLPYVNYITYQTAYNNISEE